MSGAQFNGDFETGTVGQYSNHVLSGVGPLVNPAIVTSPVRPGGSKYACAFTCSSVQYRCELVPHVSDPDSLCAMPGSDRYYGWSVLIPSAGWVSGAWQVMGQWHSNTNNGDAWDTTSPPLSINVGNTNNGLDPSHWYLGGGGNNPDSLPEWDLDLGVIIFDDWVDVVVRAVWSDVVADCLVQMWINGTQVINQEPPAALLYPTTNPNRFSFFKFGLYRDSAITSDVTVYYDNVRIGGTYASVDPSVYTQPALPRIGFYGW